MERNNVNELIYEYFTMVSEALDELIKYYRPMVVKIITNRIDDIRSDAYAYNEFLTYSDLILIDCLNKFNAYCGGNFTSFYRKSMMNRVINMQHLYYREKKTEYNMRPLQGLLHDSSNFYYSEVIANSDFGIHEQAMLNIEIEEKLRIACSRFNQLELKILYLKRRQYNSVQIAQILGINVRSVRYRVKKMKNALLNAEEDEKAL